MEILLIILIGLAILYYFIGQKNNPRSFGNTAMNSNSGNSELEKLKLIKVIIDREISSQNLVMTPKRFNNVKLVCSEVVDSNIQRKGFKWDRPVLYLVTEPTSSEQGYVITHITPKWFQFKNEGVWAEIDAIKKG